MIPHSTYHIPYLLNPWPQRCPSCQKVRLMCRSTDYDEKTYIDWARYLECEWCGEEYVIYWVCEDHEIVYHWSALVRLP